MLAGLMLKFICQTLFAVSRGVELSCIHWVLQKCCEISGVCPQGGGGTLGISGWGCATRTLEPLAYTRASFSWILLPYTRVNSPNHRFPSEFRFLTVNNNQ